MADKKKTEPETPAAHEAEKASGGILTVRGPEAGRWRAGVRFGPTPIELEIAKLTAEQIKQIESDPLLSVSRS